LNKIENDLEVIQEQHRKNIKREKTKKGKIGEKGGKIGEKVRPISPMEQGFIHAIFVSPEPFTTSSMSIGRISFA
jgi:hypothetical protein